MKALTCAARHTSQRMLPRIAVVPSLPVIPVIAPQLFTPDDRTAVGPPVEVVLQCEEAPSSRHVLAVCRGSA